jgi:hypothetical protein
MKTENAPENRHGVKHAPDSPAARINQAGDVVTPLGQYDRVELAQGLAAASFAVGLGMTGWLTRQRLERCRNAA